MRFCHRCGSAMIDVACFDPEGTIPLIIETDSNGKIWACIECSNKIGQEQKEERPMASLQSLGDFNIERRRRHEEIRRSLLEFRRNGIACPTCGSELLDSLPSINLMSNPPQKNIHCDACGYRGFRIA